VEPTRTRAWGRTERAAAAAARRRIAAAAAAAAATVHLVTQSIAWHALTITQLPATSSCGGVDNPRSSSSGFNVFSVGYCLIIIFSSELPRPIMCCCVVNCSAAHSAVACWFESLWSVHARGCSDVNKDLSQKYQDFGAEDMD